MRTFLPHLIFIFACSGSKRTQGFSQIDAALAAPKNLHQQQEPVHGSESPIQAENRRRIRSLSPRKKTLNL
jgi:hypothetical protein